MRKVVFLSAVFMASMVFLMGNGLCISVLGNGMEVSSIEKNNLILKDKLNAIISITHNPSDTYKLWQELMEKLKQLKLESHLKSNQAFKPKSLKEITELDITSKSNLTTEQIQLLLQGTNLEDLTNKFKEIEEKYNINALFLISLCAFESNWGRSYLARHKNNLVGLGARDANPIKYAKRFKSKEECLEQVSLHLTSNYLNDKGRYFKGKRVKDVNRNYCTNNGWGVHIVRIMKRLNDKLIKTSMI